MSRLKPLTMAGRLSLAFAVLILLLLGLQGSGYASLTRLIAAVELNNHTYEVLLELEGIGNSLVSIETGERGFALTGNESSLEPYHEGVRGFEQHFAQARALVKVPALQQKLSSLGELQKAWKAEAIDPVIQARREVNQGKAQVDQVIALVSQGRGKHGMEAMQGALREIREAEAALLKERSAAMLAREEFSKWLSVGGGFVGLLAAVGMALWIVRGVMQALGGEPAYAAGIARRIADGDLTVDVQVRSGAQDSLLQAMKEMRNSLAKMVVEVREASDSIATGSSQIAAGNLDLSSRTEQQAASLEETASSMEELTSTVRQNAENARQANQLASAASEIALRGGSVMSSVVETMDRISESAGKIAEIIGVIDGIAFQTNILALNAAVEAARAGEHGRGFAVVAEEVRNLARRCTAAAREIKELISDSVEKVQNGSKLVDHAGATIGEVVDSARRASDLIGEIAAASVEQSAGIEQVNQAVSQMDEVTQQNAALVEEAAAASQSLEDQGARLLQLVQAFRVEGPQHRIAASAKPASFAKASGPAHYPLATAVIRKIHSRSTV